MTTTSRTDMPASLRALLSSMTGPSIAKRRWICSSCGGEADAGYASCQPCDRDALAKRRQACADAARVTVPERARACTFGSSAIRERVCAGKESAYRRAVSAAYAWAKDPQGVLLLMGPSGVGKSSLMAATMLHVLDVGAAHDASPAQAHRAKAALWTSAFDLGNARRTTPLGQEAQLVLRATRASLLALDEIGAEKDGLGTEAVYEVLYERHASGRPTVYTSPLEREALAAKYGGGGERRLFEHATVVRLGG